MSEVNPCSRSEPACSALTTSTRSDEYPLARSSQASLRNQCRVNMTTYRLCRRVSSSATWEPRPTRRDSVGTTEFSKLMIDTWLMRFRTTLSRAQIDQRAWSLQIANARRRSSLRAIQRALVTLSTRSTTRPIFDPCPPSRANLPLNPRNQQISDDTQV